MFKTMKKRIKNEKGLTLIELLAVVVILAIVAAIAIPAIGNIINNSEVKAVKADALNILNSANLYVTENPNVTTIEYKPTETEKWAVKVETNTSPVTEKFDSFVQSLGSFKDVEFTITNTAGKVSISGKISAGGKEITFANATVDTIDADSADEDESGTDIED